MDVVTSILMVEMKDSVSIQLYKQYGEFAPSCFFILGFPTNAAIEFTLLHVIFTINMIIKPKNTF